MRAQILGNKVQGLNQPLKSRKYIRSRYNPSYLHLDLVSIRLHLQLITLVRKYQLTDSIPKMQPKFLAYIAMAFGQTCYVAASEIHLLYCRGSNRIGVILVRISTVLHRQSLADVDWDP